MKKRLIILFSAIFFIAAAFGVFLSAFSESFQHAVVIERGGDGVSYLVQVTSSGLFERGDEIWIGVGSDTLLHKADRIAFYYDGNQVLSRSLYTENSAVVPVERVVDGEQQFNMWTLKVFLCLGAAASGIVFLAFFGLNLLWPEPMPREVLKKRDLPRLPMKGE